MKYYHVLISAENRKQATTILDALLEKKLVPGGLILEGPAKFWWKGEIIDMNYAYLLTYTKEELKSEVIGVVNQSTEEEVPMVSFIPLEGNDKLIRFIDKTLK